MSEEHFDFEKMNDQISTLSGLAETRLATDEAYHKQIGNWEMYLENTPLPDFALAGVLLLGGGRFYKSQIRIVTKPGPDVMDIRCIKSEDGSFDLKALPRGEPAKIALAIPLKNVVFEQAGEYTVEIVIDDVCIHIVELHVIQE